ncbi:MAG TPA: HAMP domain-containing sensor histidine kinase [Candidatus Binataceae bacterium]|nr:HAMP domain-containing sensor histidine kinase [Candidatus Binataceae bacterium]
MSTEFNRDSRSANPAADSRRRQGAPVLNRDDETEDALQVLKLAGAFGLFFLIAYTVFDLHGKRAGATPPFPYFVMLAATLLFFGVTWMRWFRRYWKLWTLLFCTFLMLMFVAISASTHDPESRYVAIILCPLATASFVTWGPRWQAAMGAGALVIFALASSKVPISIQFQVYRWFGLLAAVLFAQCTAIFIERYRVRLRGQLEALAKAARFRETQIATMAHDIRSPVAALTGLAELLEDEELPLSDREELLARMGSTAWNMNLVVTNVLDLYRIQEDGKLQLAPQAVDPNPIVEEIVDDCALQARRKGVKIATELGELPRASVDPNQIDRIVRNFVAQAISLAHPGEVFLTTVARDGQMVIELKAPAATVSAAEMQRLFDQPTEDGPASARGLGLYVARAFAQASGGTVDVSFEPARGLNLVAELPLTGGAPAPRAG